MHQSEMPADKQLTIWNDLPQEFIDTKSTVSFHNRLIAC